MIALVQRDFAEGLDVSSKYFDISEYNCSITSATSIIEKLLEISQKNYDIIAIVRGGGDRQSMDVFNDTKLSEFFVALDAVTITAIGHTVDETLMDKLADKKFHLPHDYGAGLHYIIEKLSQEKLNSRAILIDDIKKDISKQFSEQVKTLSEQLSKKNEELQKLQESSAKQLLQNQKNFTEQQKQRSLELENYKKDIMALHEKNIQSVVNEKTAALNAKLESLQNDNKRLSIETEQNKNNYTKIIIAAILALTVGFLLAKMF